MRIPVFVSSPTALNKDQERARELVLQELNILQLEPRALGRTDYPTDYPLKEVYVIANHCSGGIILGFEQYHSESGTWKKGTSEEKQQEDPISFPTPWNNLEAGILYSLHLPLLIFRENTIRGGVFDEGVTDVFVHNMPMMKLDDSAKEAFREVFLKWSSKVRERYYSV